MPLWKSASALESWRCLERVVEGRVLARHVVGHETGDIEDAAMTIAAAKTFDYATSCLADNSVVAADNIYSQLLTSLQAKGGYVCNTEEKARLQKIMWPTQGAEIPAVEIIAKSVQKIAALAEISIPDDCRFLIVEETGVGPNHPF